MKLVQLSANKDSFRTVNFNATGLTLIVGTIGNKSSKKNHTYNGVGKSLIIELLHFCLGSKPNKSFEELLPDWEFTLVILNNNNKEQIIRRSTSHQNIVYFDDKEFSLDVFKDKLEKLSFDLELSFEFLSFRSLIDRFIRRKLEDYTDPLKLSNDFTDYQSLLKTSFLLDIDLQLIYKKHNLKTKLDVVRSSNKIFSKDVLIRDFFLNNKDEEIELRFLKEKIKQLESDQEQFKVAENYHETEKQANDLKEKLTDLRNQSVITRNAIAAIDRSLQVRTDIPAARLISAYQELLGAFKEGTVKRFELIEEFHKSLIKNRVARLSQEKIKLFNKLKEHEVNLITMHQKLDNLISFLGANKALDELISISNQISELQEKAQRIEDYQALNKQFKIDIASLKSALSNEIELTFEYLDNTKDEFEKNVDSVYRSYVKRFYPNSPSGISVRNNDKENQIRFDIDVRIENQASDGINHVRIFCFDLLVLIAGINHKVEFIFHDSRLYDGVDPRQRLEMLRLANELSMRENKQYIVTLNEDHIESMKSYWLEGEYEDLIEKNITLRLADDSDASKLLGIQIDMSY